MALFVHKKNQISVLCTYEIHNYRRTALQMKMISYYKDEDEVLIYPYVPFKILSFERKTVEPKGYTRIEVHLEEIGDVENDNSEKQSMQVTLQDESMGSKPLFGKNFSGQFCDVETMEGRWKTFLALKLDSHSSGKIRALEPYLGT